MSRLIANDLNVRLGERQILDGVSATLEPGVITVVVGPNGAGKSTLLETLAGLRKPDQGAVALDDLPIITMPARKRAQRIGFLPQTPEVAWSIDVRTLVGLGRTAYSGAWGLGVQDDLAVEHALESTGLMPFSERIVGTLSGGERARVLIARALAGHPEWLLADEPLAGLDPGHALDAMDLFRSMVRGSERGVVVTLHDLSTVMRVADRVMVLSNGAIIADGPPATALTPAVLAEAYGVEARVTPGAHSPLIEVVGRAR